MNSNDESTTMFGSLLDNKGTLDKYTGDGGIDACAVMQLSDEAIWLATAADMRRLHRGQFVWLEADEACWQMSAEQWQWPVWTGSRLCASAPAQWRV